MTSGFAPDEGLEIMDQESPRSAAVPRRSLRSIAATPHVDGGFPSSIHAGWCVHEGAFHTSIVEGQQDAVLGDYVRAVTWPEDSGVWECGPVTAGRYFELVVDPALAPTLHNEVRPEERQDQPIAPPPGLTASLYPYQMSGFAKLAGIVSHDVGALLCDEMGLGKTVQAIALLLDQKHRGQSLVIAPSSLLTNWQRELAAFAPGLTVVRHSGSGRAGVLSALSGWDIVLTSYDTAMNDISFLRDTEWNLIVLDEAQRIKNAGTLRSQVIKSLPSRACVCVTGTPVENSLTDLWSLSEASLPQLLGSLPRFESMYTDDAASALALGQIVAPITVRRAVADVAADLPPLLADDIAIDMDPTLRAFYEAAVPTGSLADVTNARVIAAHGHADPADDLVSSAKGDVVLAMLEEVFGRREKALVFASFSRSLDRLELMVRDACPNSYLAVVDGRKASDDRQAIIDRFSEFDGPGALFMNPKAAGEGLNIVAANHVFHFNPEWNPATTKQATARAYRRRQTLPVFVHHLYYADTVEDDAMVRQSQKAALADNVAAGHSSQNP